MTTSLYIGEELAHYHFGENHPFGPHRQGAFWDAVREAGLDAWSQLCSPVQATPSALARFHTQEYIAQVQQCSEEGWGYLDHGDTPAFRGVYEAASVVVGSVLHAVHAVMAQHTRRAFIPIAGLHHARPDRAAGFCVFNDIGVAIETLKQEYRLSRIAYVDIDAHHGDGVYYPFEADPSVLFADIHEDGHFLYPGTGQAQEQGQGAAVGTKRNLPLPPGAQDADFFEVWLSVEEWLRAQQPQFVLMQGGVDSLAGDPLAHLAFSPRVHAFVTTRLLALAEECCEGRLVVTGGGGYRLSNVARGWTAILRSLLEING